MLFTQTELRQGGTIRVIDGYSKAKTIKGAIKDMGREVAKYDAVEAESLINNPEDSIGTLNIHYEDCDYFLDCEEVEVATKIDADGNPVRYAEANFYMCISFVVKDEPEKNEIQIDCAEIIETVQDEFDVGVAYARELVECAIRSPDVRHEIMIVINSEIDEKKLYRSG